MHYIDDKSDVRLLNHAGACSSDVWAVALALAEGCLRSKGPRINNSVVLAGPSRRGPFQNLFGYAQVRRQLIDLGFVKVSDRF